MVEKQQGKDYREGYPKSELLVDRDVGESVEEEESRDGDADRGGVVDVDGADEVALFAFELERTIAAMLGHLERLAIQIANAAARAAQAQTVGEHGEDSCHANYAGTLLRAALRVGVTALAPPFKYSRRKRAV